MRKLLLLAAFAALVVAAPAAAFVPADPLAPKQWYLEQDHAFDAWQVPPPTLAPVKIAIVDSGLDCTLPDFVGRIADAHSFVGGDPCSDTEGHGTFVAGEIAANLDTQGIAGMAYSSQLLVAKVVDSDGTIPLKAEAAAIRWAADRGAKVINLSLGGVRDPVHTSRDTFSTLEANAVAYAYSKGALLVAAVGNGDEAFSEPWPYASYPAALPHVIGVGALTRSGNVPDFSNRDPVFNDLVAPGVGIFSTFPAPITALRPSCVDQGFSDCGSDEYRNAEGTSFAAPQVSAAAAMLFAVAPQLTNSQVANILEHSADDVSAANGCSRCTPLRDPLSGWGRLDVARAIAELAGPLPAADRYETNDDAGTHAFTFIGKKRSLTATLDYYDDPVDVYRIALSGREKLVANMNAGWTGANVSLTLWKPGTLHVDDPKTDSRFRVAQSAHPGSSKRIRYTAHAKGWYYLEARATSPGFGQYSLSFVKLQPNR
jgi:hypothetical protein